MPFFSHCVCGASGGSSDLGWPHSRVCVYSRLAGEPWTGLSHVPGPQLGRRDDSPPLHTLSRPPRAWPRLLPLTQPGSEKVSRSMKGPLGPRAEDWHAPTAFYQPKQVPRASEIWGVEGATKSHCKEHGHREAMRWGCQCRQHQMPSQSLFCAPMGLFPVLPGPSSFSCLKLCLNVSVPVYSRLNEVLASLCLLTFFRCLS